MPSPRLPAGILGPQAAETFFSCCFSSRENVGSSSFACVWRRLSRSARVLISTESSISPGSTLHCVHKGMFLKREPFTFLVERLAAVSERSEEGDPGISRGSSCPPKGLEQCGTSILAWTKGISSAGYWCETFQVFVFSYAQSTRLVKRNSLFSMLKLQCCSILILSTLRLYRGTFIGREELLGPPAARLNLGESRG
jgi:hypothetical protein